MTAQKFNVIQPYINGNFVALDKPEYVFSNLNPAKPSDCLAKMGWNRAFIESSVSGMQSAQKKFLTLSLEDRLNHVLNVISFLKENSDEIKSKMMQELSRSRLCVEEEWKLCEKLFSYLPEYCTQTLRMRNEEKFCQWQYAPLGMILISSNVSLPFYSLLATSLVSLVAGNAVCLCPSLHCVLSANLLAQAFHQSCFPNGLIQVIYGDFEIFRRLILTHKFDVILYTGDEESLEQIRRDTQSQQDIRLVLCGAGKNAAYVSETARLDEAIQKITLGACLDAGQRLESTSLVFASEKIVDEFVDKFIESIKKTPIGVTGDLTRSDVHVMGPLCSETAWERFLRFQGIAARESCQTLRWGKPIDNFMHGYFVSPGIHYMKPDKVTKSVYASNAFFGPDVCIVPVENEIQVISILDSLAAARCLSVHTQSFDMVSYLRKYSAVPSLLWNTATTEINPILPAMGKGHAGNSTTSGLHFLLSTVYPQSLNFSFSLEMNQFDPPPMKAKKKTSKVNETRL